MIVMVNMSDLAAVGAQPLGILISEILPPTYSDEALSLLQKGIGDACSACGTFVLGGDTNSGERLQMTGCAVGTVPCDDYFTRLGCKPGDLLFASGPLGQGNAYAIQKLLSSGPTSIQYMPSARLREGKLLRGLANACMDTSDGTLATLDQLMRLNSVGFEVELEPALILDPLSLAAAEDAGLPPWLLLAGQHGEFELLFTVPPERENELHVRSTRIDWTPVRLGKVTENRNITLPLYGTNCELDTAFLRNLSTKAGIDVAMYVRELVNYDVKIRKGAMEYAR
jgi:thiamine-monophosphate kinase